MTGGDDTPPYRTEVAGWIAFLIFVLFVYELRRRLNRSAPEQP